MTRAENASENTDSTSDDVENLSFSQEKTQKKERLLNLLANLHYLLALVTAAKVVLGLPFMVSGYAAMGGEKAQDVPSWFLTGVHWISVLYDVPEFEKEPAFIALIMFLMGSTLVIVSLMHAAFLTWIGRCIHQRKKLRTLLFFSWMDLLYIPLGTLLSVASIYFLRNDEVRDAFQSVNS